MMTPMLSDLLAATVRLDRMAEAGREARKRPAVSPEPVRASRGEPRVRKTRRQYATLQHT